MIFDDEENYQKIPLVRLKDPAHKKFIDALIYESLTVFCHRYVTEETR